MPEQERFPRLTNLAVEGIVQEAVHLINKMAWPEVGGVIAEYRPLSDTHIVDFITNGTLTCLVLTPDIEGTRAMLWMENRNDMEDTSFVPVPDDLSDREAACVIAAEFMFFCQERWSVHQQDALTPRVLP